MLNQCLVQAGSRNDVDSRRPSFSRRPRDRSIARALYAHIRDLPIVSPHDIRRPRGCEKRAFPDPDEILVQPEPLRLPHALQPGSSLHDLEIGRDEMKDPRRVWRIFAKHYFLFRERRRGSGSILNFRNFLA